MRIVTWNINGIRARIEVLLQWLREENPDVVMLQEIKSVDETFPVSALEDQGYNVYLHGQKGFNGVAFLSKKPLEDIVCGLAGDDSD
jgi:exodeoxyribonuclease-3